MKRCCDVGKHADHPRGHRGLRRSLHRRYARRSSSSSEDQRTDQLRRQQRIKRTFAQTVRGHLLHHQRSGAEVFYIHRYQVVEFIVISNSPLCNLGLFQSEVGSVWGVFEYRKSNPGGFQVRIGGRGRRRVGRSTAEDTGEDLHREEPRQHQIIDGRGSRRDLHPEDQRPDQLIAGRGSRRGPSSRRSATGSTIRRRKIKEKTVIQRISDRINSSSEEDQGEELHPEDQREDRLIDGR